MKSAGENLISVAKKCNPQNKKITFMTWTTICTNALCEAFVFLVSSNIKKRVVYLKIKIWKAQAAYVKETAGTDEQCSGGKMRMRLILWSEEPELEAPVLTHIQPSLWQHPHTFLYVPAVLLCGSSFLTHHYPPLSSVSAAGERISLNLVANHRL